MTKIVCLSIGIVALLTCSCKRTYSCKCTTSYTYKNSSGGFANIIIPGNGTSYSEKMTEKKAKAACKHEENAIQTDFTNGITGNGQGSLVAGESISTSCSIISK